MSNGQHWMELLEKSKSSSLNPTCWHSAGEEMLFFTSSASPRGAVSRLFFLEKVFLKNRVTVEVDSGLLGSGGFSVSVLEERRSISSKEEPSFSMCVCFVLYITVSLLTLLRVTLNSFTTAYLLYHCLSYRIFLDKTSLFAALLNRTKITQSYGFSPVKTRFLLLRYKAEKGVLQFDKRCMING